MRTSFSASAPFPVAIWKIKFLLVHIHQQQRPGVRPQHLIDLLHDGAQDLIELEGRSERLAEFVEYGHFA